VREFRTEARGDEPVAPKADVAADAPAEAETDRVGVAVEGPPPSTPESTPTSASATVGPS